MEQTWNFSLDYSTLSIYLSKIVEKIKSSRSKENLYEMIFSVFYSHLSCTFSKFQIKSFKLIFNSVFRDDSGKIIDVKELDYFPALVNISDFAKNNGIHEFTYHKRLKILKRFIHCRSSARNFIISGEDVKYEGDNLLKGILYAYNLNKKSIKKAVRINLDVLNEKDLFGSRTGQ